MRRTPKERELDFDLGLAVLEAMAQPGETFSRSEIANLCNCSPHTVELIETAALLRVRRLLEASVEAASNSRRTTAAARLEAHEGPGKEVGPAALDTRQRGLAV